MITNRMGSFGLIAGGLIAGISLTAVQGCDDLAAQCGLVCESDAFVQGKFNISGNASVDAFFSATLDVAGAMNGVAEGIQVELAALYGLVGAEVGGDFKAALDAKLSAYIEGGITVRAEPARCEASLDITAKAAAECDVNASPGSVEVQCMGSCSIDASAQADCAAAGGLTCKGTAPNLACEGTCQGGCQLEIAAACEGTCRGQCDGQDFEGRCDGMCQGECDLGAGGSCGGRCTGSCEWTPPSGSCDASLEARCSASAEANVECKGGCTGKAEPPMVSAECKATVEAKAEASVQCYPPSLTIDYQLKAGVMGDLAVKAEFEAFISNFRTRYAALLAAIKRAEGLVSVSGNLAAAGSAAIQGLAADLQANGDLKASIGAGCAIATLPKAAELLTSAGQNLGAQVSAAGSVTASVAGG